MIPKTKGDCECCTTTDTQLYQMHGNILMCRDCMEREQAAINASRDGMKSAQTMMNDSRVVDSSIKLKSDVFLAKTTAAIELRAMIEQDDTIPATEKEYAYAKEMMLRFKNLQKAIFEMRTELNEKENEMRMWQVNTQTAAGKLHEKYRAEFHELDVNYRPTPIVKKVQTTKPVRTAKSFDKVALADACKKYGIPEHAAIVRMMMVSRNGLSADNAAKELADKMGITTSVK